MRARNVKNLAKLVLPLMLCIIVIMQFACSIAIAQEVATPKVQQRVFIYDQEGLLSAKQKEELNSLLIYLEEKTSIEFVVVTSSSFFGMNVDDYAHDLFNSLELGKSSKDNGILFVVSKAEGHARLEIGYGLESVLTDSKCGEILDAYYVPNRDSGNHAESVYYTAFATVEVLGKAYGINFSENQEAIMNEINSKLLQAKIIHIAFYVILFIIVVILAVHCDGSSSGGGRYSGGYSSSGGGAHFGGGHSGGGGASR